MAKGHWIFVVAMTTLCVQATGNIDALEKKMEMFERQLKSCDTRLNSYEKQTGGLKTKLENYGTRLDNHDTRLEKLEAKPSRCGEWREVHLFLYEI